MRNLSVVVQRALLSVEPNECFRLCSPRELVVPPGGEGTVEVEYSPKVCDLLAFLVVAMCGLIFR